MGTKGLKSVSPTQTLHRLRPAYQFIVMRQAVFGRTRTTGFETSPISCESDMDIHSAILTTHSITTLAHNTNGNSAGLSAMSSALGSSEGSLISTAMQVASNLSDLGKAVPFVAPAFVLLKIIIDVEQRAQEVDLKCNDILERIVFMLSHLTVLKEIEILPSTKKVVERINEVMKGALALITSYRKQGKVARRLSLSNREKFMQCAEAINTCCQDLLMSLQIHQSKQLETLLSRGVPIDEEDTAAKTFVEEHGGSVDALLHDRELVKEFATQQHLVMDDSVMEQLNSNLTDSVQQTTSRLEEVLRENLASAVVDGFKELLAQLSTAATVQDNEQKFICVQCESSFAQSSNHATACSFHKAEYDSWSKRTPCCSTPHPCAAGPHRSKHHCDYPYSTFFPRARGVTWYVDTHKEFARVEDTNLETDDKQEASVSQLLRWATRGERVQEPTLLVRVGRCWWTEKYYWNTWTAKELEDVSRSVRISKRTLIFKTTREEKAEEYAMAEWILSVSGRITGVQLTAKSATSPTPFVRVCPLDLSTCTQTGNIIAVSDGGMRSYAPSSAYTLPPGARYGPTLDDAQVRPPRTNFKTRTSTATMKLIMKATEEPPLVANPDLASSECDWFIGKLSLFNNNTTTNTPITISTIRVEWRLVGSGSQSPAYTPIPAGDLKLVSAPVMPFALSPRETCLVHFQATIPRMEADKKLQVRWWNRSFNRDIRKHPLRIKLICEDVESEEASLVTEYVWKPMQLEKRKETDENELEWFGFDNPVLWERYVVKPEKGDPLEDIICNMDTKVDAVQVAEKVVIKIGGQDLKVQRLHKVVHTALKTGKTEVDLGIGQERNTGSGEKWAEDGEGGLGGGAWYWDAYALVDISCRRVYAVKVVVRLGVKEKSDDGLDRRTSIANTAKGYGFGCLGYVILPLYGDVVPGKTRPISYATEAVRLPRPEIIWQEEEKDPLLEDGLDDFKPPIPPKPAVIPTSPAANGTGANDAAVQWQLPPEVNNRLESIDRNLARIADVFERLANVMAPSTHPQDPYGGIANGHENGHGYAR